LWCELRFSKLSYHIFFLLAEIFLWKPMKSKVLMLVNLTLEHWLGPHSQCSRRKNPKLFQNLKLKNNTIKDNFRLIFKFNICRCNSALASHIKNNYYKSGNCVYFINENLLNLTQKHKWALWIRHLILGQYLQIFKMDFQVFVALIFLHVNY
jgi:hypothetical protein